MTSHVPLALDPKQDPRTFVVERGESVQDSPVRLVVVQGEERPAVDSNAEPVVMTFPHLLVRELIALLALSLGLVLMAIFFNAPLEEMANPEKTPNPAKAPWYFLGLQELLHYYPPLVSGVLLPGLVVTALAIVPYFDINLHRAPLWSGDRRKTAWGLAAAVAALTVVFLFTGAHPVWPIIAPLWLVAAAAGVPGVLRGCAWVDRWLGERSLAFWVFAWFLAVAVTLTVIGVAFRGPGWTFTVPWRDGLYY